MSKYKLIVMDMDDTLMNHENQVGEETKDYLIKIQDEGYKVVLASGRPTEGMLPTARLLNLDAHQSHVISYNGGNTVDVATENVTVNKPVSKENFDQIVDYCRKKSFFVLTYHDGHIIYEGEHEYMNIEAELTGLPMKKVDDLKAYIQDAVPKVMGVDYVCNIVLAKSDLAGSFNDEIDVTTSKPYFLEFMAKDVSKGNAVSALCDKLGISLEEVIAFGDSSNDISMLSVVGHAIAMGNANDEVKSIADEVTLSNADNGIPHTLKQKL
ncbi:Cof-type HAD-IIB family hydrolase [Staphylococcus arlettae]|uniref:Cof-type HAD-IIB family hydrolase n=1 Tax=Staphylococcus arlettae TaxID=29378 RepID=UPI000D1AA856|nr:Cof-type HAD-IIB family hydrolase [Staphylococcus arlettae]MEB6065502.1 Cof-type HAD-IIB family hydrolase [Staphylococcus arlettae]PTH44791.1 Cof-type HAD-IIB family hydrolase [Staphylococcus arlettae]PTH58714.1 Cof-type HAD-IIB family hydrolase [Staphylococcus arlettae]RIM60762.1 HAD family phosphatase [Staphylococcus arlettae]